MNGMTISSTVILQVSEDRMLNTEISLKSFWNPKRASSSTISKTAFAPEGGTQGCALGEILLSQSLVYPTQLLQRA